MQSRRKGAGFEHGYCLIREKARRKPEVASHQAESGICKGGDKPLSPKG